MKETNPSSGRLLLALVVAAGALGSGGCEVDSFFDPSKTGYFEHMPTTIPILDRIDVIEQESDVWGETTAVTPSDLIPGDLSYKLSPNDVLTVQIFELYSPGQWHVSTRRIDAGGFFRLPEIGDVQSAGMTAQEFEDRITRLLDEQVMENPLVDVVVEDSGGFMYTIYGAIRGTGMYRLSRPDLRVLAALAQAGGVPLSTERVFVIRQVELTEDVLAPYLRGTDQARPAPEKPDERSIEDLIDDLDPGGGGVQPGIFQQDEPLVDVDDLEPVPAGQPATGTETRSGPIQETLPPDPAAEDTFIYDEQRDEWVRVRATRGPEPETDTGTPPMVLERVIEIPFQRLKRGDSSLNVVVRPDDRIYVEEAPSGVVYLDGEIQRPGVYNLPITGRLTLSRLVAAAGGFGPLAIPERVDLTRVVGDKREATIRLNLKAIRTRTEPDIYLKPDDHVIVGTNFWAAPLAVMRSGFRATYGFGFLLDRNFGNDVFGAPPTNLQ